VNFHSSAMGLRKRQSEREVKFTWSLPDPKCRTRELLILIFMALQQPRQCMYFLLLALTSKS
ncbi:hypothetical protein CHS0354_025655, partial [Potamilus streckersoni]